MQKEVIEEMAKHLGVTPQDIRLNDSLENELGLGPVELSEILSALSEQFKIIIDPQEAANLHTVNDIVVMVEDLSLE
jgi:acyl carrier protein